MTHLFGIGGNPFATPVGQMIEKATDGSQASENWALYMEVCDLINETEDGPKDAAKAIKKRLSHNAGKNYQVVMFSLTMLETCVKNCGRRFHMQIGHKDFLQDLVKIIGPKNDPPQIVQEKILALIQTWADAFQGIPELKEVGKIYVELKSKGIEFPATDLDHMAPIHTPARTTPGVDPPQLPPQRTGSLHAHAQPAMGSPPRRAQTMPHGRSMPVQHVQPQVVGPVMLGPEQLAKLKSELDIVQQNMKVFSEMLAEVNPANTGPPDDMELLHDLNRTCKEMQMRIMELIERVQNEEVTGELLRMNDDLNNLFLRYERFERLGKSPAAGRTPTAAAIPPAAATDPTAASDVSPLAGLMPKAQPPAYKETSSDMGSGSVSGTLNQLNTTPATNAGGTDEFDMFAQSRQSFEQSKQTPAGGAYMNQVYDQYPGGLGAAVAAKPTSNSQQLDKASEYDEMEKWLKENPGKTFNEPATSVEFDQFLAQRARAADSVPDADPDSRQNQRQMKGEEPENTLFAL